MKRKSKNQSKNKTLNFLRYLGPGLLVTVGFIDPGNWASNIAAGSGFGYELLWMVTLSTVMLIVLQHTRHIWELQPDCVCRKRRADICQGC